MQPERTIYVVDDDADVRQSLKLMLQVSGFRVEVFDSGRRFLDAVGRLDPGSVLLDLRMTGMDGIQVLAELAGREPGWPVMVMTGHGEPEVGEEAIAAGAAAFIEKPFDEALLFRCIDEGWSRMRAGAESPSGS
jgi:FixJ family two-component response regulator